MPRLFSFQGSDAEYINYLEGKVLEAQRISPSFKASDSQSTPIHFVIWQPPNRAVHPSERHRQVPRWKKELNYFISSLPRPDGWEQARREAGLCTPEKNRLAIQLMLGRMAESRLRPLDSPIPNLPTIRPTDNRELILKGCLYGQYISAWNEESRFAYRITNFQRLIFTSYCAVLLHVGSAKETVYAIMQQYLGRDYDQKTLDYYRYGALWVNRCIASLLQQGWGLWSWELFLLQTRSPAQFGRFAINSSLSFIEVATRLGSPPTMTDDDRWIPYCLPCMVQSLMGNTVELSDICKCLGYDIKVISSVQGRFSRSLEKVGDLAVC